MSRRRTLPTPFALLALVCAALAVLGGLSTPPASAITATGSSGPSVVSVCDRHPAPGYATCYAEQVVNTVMPMTAGGPAGLGPSDLQDAYRLPSSTGGVGETVYIIDAYDDPHAESDLAAYRSMFGLAPCTTANGCFKKLNQSGAASPLPVANTGWATEATLDIEMVSAACPNCNIRLIESNDNGSSLYTAVRTAVALGAKFVSMSWGGPESSGETSLDASFAQSGVLFAASTGDNGYAGGTSYPAASPSVLAVGGTALVRDSSTRGWSETAWGSASGGGGAGSGCSAFEAKPARQGFVPSALCAGRTPSDVSAVADPRTGVAVALNGGWSLMGGTSASAPLVAAMYALAGEPGATDRPETYPYGNTSKLYDVTTGATGSCGTLVCTAATGWDGPTGLGSPNGIGAFSGTGSDTPVISYLGGRADAASATPGLPSTVTATPIVPTGHQVASVAWTAGRPDCTFADPTALSTTVTCNATATGSTKVTATVTDDAGHRVALAATLAFVVPTVKRAVALDMTLDRQGDPASVCTGLGAPMVGSVVDVATGQPVKGLSVTFGGRAATATLFSTVGSAVTTADGTATRTQATSVASVYRVTTAAVGPFAAATGPSVSVTPARCTPALTASADHSAAWYGDPLTYTGAVTRADPRGAGTLPVAGAPVTVTVQPPSTVVSGRTVVPAPVVLGTATSAADGTWRLAVKATVSGTVQALIRSSTALAPTSVDLGALTVSVATSAVTATPSATEVLYGRSITVTGAVTRTTDTTGPASRVSVAISLLKPGTTSPISLGTVVTGTDGRFSLAVIPRVTGELRVAYAGAPGTTGSATSLGTVTVDPWTTSVTLSSSAAQVLVGGRVTLSGTVAASGADGSTAAPALPVKLILTKPGGATVLLATVTSIGGRFSVSVAPPATGTLTAQVSGVAGYLDATSTGVGITVG